jgi:hypothetical protein
MSSYTKAIEQFTARYAGEWTATVRAVQATGSPHAKPEFIIDLPML